MSRKHVLVHFYALCNNQIHQMHDLDIFGGAASQYTGLSARPPACLPVCQFQLAPGEVSLTLLTSTIVGECRRVFYNYPGPKNE